MRFLKMMALAGALVGIIGLASFADLSGELEIFSWWAGDEGPALEALIALYNGLYPGVDVIND